LLHRKQLTSFLPQARRQARHLRQAWPRQQARRRVVVVHDQVGIGLVALQRDPHDHLAQRRPGQGVGPAERLRAEDHMDPEGPALADDPV